MRRDFGQGFLGGTNRALEILFHQLELLGNAVKGINGSLKGGPLSDGIRKKGWDRRFSFAFLKQKGLRG
ncbi:MAG: hypothetical protein A2W10_07385 [Deltaproteobacteria bacterium RBG_16_55_12]|nr:MAG: hypothetical protein A2X89_05785 [Deltaproteobacteria bacterium GWD2_55_8]OGP99256.1 MAG: hypothetical protein A2W10_07385 [Deltaproteobacteria bacterium RBG_16_55_12]